LNFRFRSIFWGGAAIGATLATAQTGALHVRVVDAGGDPLPGAVVTLSNTESLVPRTTIRTDPEGRVEFPILRPGGGYAVEVTVPGHARFAVENLRVRIGDDLESIVNQSSFWLHRRKPDDLRIRNTNVSPRLSVAWDPGHGGKSKLAFSPGRYYDKIFLAVPLIEVEPIDTFLTFFAYPRGAGADRRFVVFQDDTPLFNGTINTRTVDRNLRTPYQDELSVAYEREVAPETTVKVTLLRRWFRDQIQDTDIGALALSADAFNLLNDDTARILDVTDDMPNVVRRFGRRFQLGIRVAL